MGTSMREKTSIENLEDFAKEKGIQYYTNSSVSKNFLSPNERYISTKFIVYDLNQRLKNLFLVFYDSYSTKAYTSNTYCGLFKRIPKCNNEIKIIKRDWFDFLSFRKRLKTGDKYIDKHISIYSELNAIDSSIINSKTIREFVDINNKILALELTTRCESMSIVPELHGKDLIALKTNAWILEKDLLMMFIEKGSNLLEEIN